MAFTEIKTEIKMGLMDALSSGAVMEVVEKTNQQALADMADRASDLVHVDTGLTKSTIRVEGDAMVVGGAGLLLEFGWHTRSGRLVGPFPFIMPAFTAVVPQIPEALRANMEAWMHGLR